MSLDKKNVETRVIFFLAGCDSFSTENIVAVVIRISVGAGGRDSTSVGVGGDGQTSARSCRCRIEETVLQTSLDMT